MRHLGLLAVGFGLLVSTPAFAQNGFSATYDSARQIKLKGAVTRIDWVNPHAFFSINVVDSAGTTANWAVEFGNPLELEKDGWKRSSLHIGDVVTVDGLLARGEARQVFAKSIVLARTNAKLFTASTQKRAPAAGGPTPRWPDGQPRLGPAPVGHRAIWA